MGLASEHNWNSIKVMYVRLYINSLQDKKKLINGNGFVCRNGIKLHLAVVSVHLHTLKRKNIHHQCIFLAKETSQYICI